MKIVAPCKDCERRHVGCHSECDDYDKYIKIKKERSAQIRKNRNDILLVDGYEQKKARRLKRYQ